MTMSSQFMLGFSRAAAKSPRYSVATIYKAEEQGGVIAYDVGDQMVFRKLLTTFGIRDLPSEDKLGLWLGNYADGTGASSGAGSVTLTVMTDLLLDSSFLIRLKGTLYHVLEVRAGDLTCHGIFPPPAIRVLPMERTDDEANDTNRRADHRHLAGA